jgi:uncharacterized protein (TIGR04562 family)
MEKQNYLNSYLFDWDVFSVVVGGRSAMDTKYFIASMSTVEEVHHFLRGYGIDPESPVSKAELFGNFQEALQFIKRYFLIEGSPDGLPLKIPNSLYMVTDITELFLMATGKGGYTHEERLWAEVALKIIHTILHVDKDLRSNYFNVIQTQIFDQFYRYVTRDEDKVLSFTSKDGKDKILLVDFETKSKKSRDSVIIKLLHKAEHVAEELFDRVGVRIITHNKLDSLRVLKFLIHNNVIIPHNIKPSRSANSLFDLNYYKTEHYKLIKQAIKDNLTEEEFRQKAEKILVESNNQANDRNAHSSKNYHSIQFTCRQLIKYKNPFVKDFLDVRNLARDNGDNELAKKILALDQSLISRDISFFYPYEVQLTDIESHRTNTEGEASHIEYKKTQVKAAMNRLFWALKREKNLE